jgi:hypothetical protein
VVSSVVTGTETSSRHGLGQKGKTGSYCVMSAVLAWNDGKLGKGMVVMAANNVNVLNASELC